MKTLLGIILFGMTIGCGYAQTEPSHEWKVTLKVVDDTGQPVAGAEVLVNYLSTHFSGITDTNGVFTASHVDQSVQLAFQVQKLGYYSYQTQYLLGFKYDTEKWHPTVTTILKRVSKPIAMYAKQNLQMVFPEYNKAIGYDLEIGDWVAPYGKGINADLFFTEAHPSPQSGYIISVSFPNIGDGIQEFTVPDAEKGSALRSEQKAPADGYQSTASQTETTNPKRNFYFRVHTKLDENGNVVSARYGKIYGDLAQFTYYYNPTPNDRSIEFDPKQSLLHSRFKVYAP